MKVLAIDPGNEKSAYCIWDGSKILDFGKINNDALIDFIAQDCLHLKDSFDFVVIEMIASYGMPVGKEVFETCLFIGRIQQLCANYDFKAELIYRKDVKMHFCQSMKAKDSNIRQALIDRFGDKGTKKAPGLTYGISADVWSAFAIGVYYHDKERT